MCVWRACVRALLLAYSVIIIVRSRIFSLLFIVPHVEQWNAVCRKRRLSHRSTKKSHHTTQHRQRLTLHVRKRGDIGIGDHRVRATPRTNDHIPGRPSLSFDPTLLNLERPPFVCPSIPTSPVHAHFATGNFPESPAICWVRRHTSVPREYSSGPTTRRETGWC